MTVVAGYIRMLLKDRAGPLSDQQRRLLEEAEKSCGRLSALLAEVSDLSSLEAGTAPFNRATVNLRAVFEESITSLPELPDYPVEIQLQAPDGGTNVDGDHVRLRTALTSVLSALRRELVTTTQLFVRQDARIHDSRPAAWIVIAGADRIDQLSSSDESALTTFDEWRGGCGLTLAIARRVIDAHGGRIWSPVDDARAGAVLMLPAR
jgi:signal transduction histidine kinase